MEGWIKLSRKLLDWEWHQDPNTMTVLVHLLLLARFNDGKWKNTPLARGQVITGRKKLAAVCGLSESQTKTALKHLINSGTLTIQATNEYSVVTFVNWDLYQQDPPASDQQPAQRITNESPTNDQRNAARMTTTEECKERENEKREENLPPSSSRRRSTQEVNSSAVLKLATACNMLQSDRDAVIANQLIADHGELRVHEAISRSSADPIRTNWSYVRSILQKWSEQGYMDADGKENGRMEASSMRRTKGDEQAVKAYFNRENEKKALQRMQGEA